MKCREGATENSFNTEEHGGLCAVFVDSVSLLKIHLKSLKPQMSQMNADKSSGSTDSTDSHRLENKAPKCGVVVPQPGLHGRRPRGAFRERRTGASHDLRPSRRPPSAGPCASVPKPICEIGVISVICGSAFDLEIVELRLADLGVDR
jgi:hypothetical protein